MIFTESLSVALLLACSWTADAFTTNTKYAGPQSTFVSQRPNTARRHGSLLGAEQRIAPNKLHMSSNDMSPEKIFPLGEENVITPEGFGFSSPVIRILDLASRNGGYYSAKASNIVTDVMDEITNGKADVALVFEDGENGELEGIFTETDYIEVCFNHILD